MGDVLVLKRVSPWIFEVLEGEQDLTQLFVLSESYHLTIRLGLSPNELSELRRNVHDLSASTTRSLLHLMRSKNPRRYAQIEPYLDRFEEEWRDPALNLEKTWLPLHYLLSGSTEADNSPLSNAVLGGRPLAPGLDDPPVEFLTVAQTRETSIALSRFTFDVLDERYASTPPRAIPFWPGGTLEFVHEIVATLTDYYAKAATEGKGMLLNRS